MTATEPRSDWRDPVGLAGVALDEVVLAVMRHRQAAAPDHLAPDDVVAELASAAELFDERGWLQLPATYHRQPPPLRTEDISVVRPQARMHRHYTVTFPSGFRPRAAEPGVARFPNAAHNDTVVVRLLRHARRPDAPWVVCLHGFGMGTSRFDLSTLWASHLHRRLGFNVAVPVAPLHGPRRTADDIQLLSLDLVSTLHGITQAIWDVRRLIGWIRDNGGTRVGVYGLSLGGYLAALLAGIEELDVVVAGIPFADVLGLMAHHGPPPEYLHTMRSGAANRVLRVVNPVTMGPAVPPERLAILAARGDRLIPREQTLALWREWDRTALHWVNGGHVGYTWSREARRFTGGRLRSALVS